MPDAKRLRRIALCVARSELPRRAMQCGQQEDAPTDGGCRPPPPPLALAPRPTDGRPPGIGRPDLLAQQHGQAFQEFSTLATLTTSTLDSTTNDRSGARHASGACGRKRGVPLWSPDGSSLSLPDGASVRFGRSQWSQAHGGILAIACESAAYKKADRGNKQPERSAFTAGIWPLAWGPVPVNKRDAVNTPDQPRISSSNALETTGRTRLGMAGLGCDPPRERRVGADPLAADAVQSGGKPGHPEEGPSTHKAHADSKARVTTPQPTGALFSRAQAALPPLICWVIVDSSRPLAGSTRLRISRVQKRWLMCRDGAMP